MRGFGVGVLAIWTLLAADARATSCNDAIENGGETDVDCGGNLCPSCPTGRKCLYDTDCSSRFCAAGGVCVVHAIDAGRDRDATVHGTGGAPAIHDSGTTVHDSGTTVHDSGTTTIRDATVSDADEDASSGSTQGSGGLRSNGGSSASPAAGGRVFDEGPKPVGTGAQGKGGMSFVTGGGDSGHPASASAGAGGAPATSFADAAMSDHVAHAASESGGCGCRTSPQGAGESAAAALGALMTVTAFARRSTRAARSRRRTRRGTRDDRSLR